MCLLKNEEIRIFYITHYGKVCIYSEFAYETAGYLLFKFLSLLIGRMLLCVRERSISDTHKNQNHSSLQRQFSHGHSQKFEDGGSGSGTRVSHFLPTSRRIVQFSNGKVVLLKFPYGILLEVLFICKIVNL